MKRMRWKRPSPEVHELFVGDKKRACIFSCVRLAHGDRVYVYWAEFSLGEASVEGWSTALSYAKAKCEEIARLEIEETA